ncbi:MAG TPA: diguanylate cyclase [Nevskia sp.]|nr:diguanylate cyclase [Nevskia sp.]
MVRAADPRFQTHPPPAAALEAARESDAASAENLRFIDRMRGLRSMGVGLAFLSIAGVFYANHASPLSWAALAFNGFIWPHLAWYLARRSPDPYAAERRNLMIDSASAGVWVVLMHFNLLPSALLVAMLSMDKVCVGGWRFLARTAAAQLAAALVTLLLYGFRFEPMTTLPQILLCLPFLTAYPIGVATLTFALASKVRRQNKLLAELNRSDPLTGLLNRSHWEELVLNELRRHQRLGRPAALLMLDIDSFKPINDQHGHPAGDAVIRGVAGIIGLCVRDVDIAGRYGGDEFGIVLPEADTAQACAVAERIRHSVQAASLGTDGSLRCTVSIGLALVGTEMHGSRDWITGADQALYRAKTLGRNRVATPAPNLKSTG